MPWYLLSAINGNLYFLEIRTQVLSVNPVSDCRLFFKNSYLNHKLYNLKLSSHAKKAQKRVQKIKKETSKTNSHLRNHENYNKVKNIQSRHPAN